ncbi:MAG: rhodanese-like domain-containing protein [Akkermansiaceae bacterium]|nr:rhodanese-like domain-containing protein [Akkermansiaceae bacterium]
MKFNAPLQALTIGALSLVAAAITWAVVDPPEPEKTSCDPATIPDGEICLQSIDDEQGVLWVDARSRKEWERNGLNDSLLWNLDADEDMNAFEREFFMTAAPRASDGTLQVVVYCSDKQCGTSKQVAARIRKLDLPMEVRVLHGGWRALKQAGRIPGP